MSNQPVRYGENTQFRTVLAPQDITGTATATNPVSFKYAHWITFAVNLGVITGASLDVTVEAMAANTTGATDVAIPFNYRLSAVVSSDDPLGAITDGTSAGFSITASDDNKLLLIDVDPLVAVKHLSTAQYVRVVLTPSSSAMSACLVSAVAMLEPRYPRLSHLTSS